MIKRIVSRLIKKHKTNDPFEIAAQKNIIILFNYLGGTFGFFSTYKRAKFIHINSNLDEPMQRFVCAHELGHVVLHPNVNTPFMRAHTLFSIDKIEKEANKFAVELLIPDEIVHEHETIFAAAASCGVPAEVAILKRINHL